METAIYDVAIIGGGPGGYVAAIRAAQLGKKVVCIDKRAKLGGTCLNIGCIPSKALLHVSAEYEAIRQHVAIYGIQVKEPTINLVTMMDYKNKVVDDLTKGIEGLFRKNKITFVQGQAVLDSPGKIMVRNNNQEQLLQA